MAEGPPIDGWLHERTAKTTWDHPKVFDSHDTSDSPLNSSSCYFWYGGVLRLDAQRSETTGDKQFSFSLLFNLFITDNQKKWPLAACSCFLVSQSNFLSLNLVNLTAFHELNSTEFKGQQNKTLHHRND